MSENINLKEIERKAWRSTFQDGLWDIYLGMILFSMALSTLVDEITLTEVWRYAVYFGFLIFSMAVLWAGKRFITTPRMGQVKFGPKSESRKRKTRLLLFASVAFGLVVFFLSVGVYRGDFGQGLPWNILFPLIYALNMLLVGGLGAYFLDFPRLYVIAVLFALPIPMVEITKQTLSLDVAFYAFAVPALVIICMGLFYLVKFVRKYPVVEMDHDVIQS